MIVEPSIIQGLSGLVTSPAEVAVLVGTTRYLESQYRRKQGLEITVILEDLWFATQAYIPGVRWDLHAHPRLARTFAGLMLLASVGSGLVCYLLPRRYAWSLTRRVGWGFSGLLLGPTGLLLMIALMEWPARIVCANCQRLRVVERDMCEHCGAAHAVTIPDGTEIFEQTARIPQRALATH